MSEKIEINLPNENGTYTKYYPQISVDCIKEWAREKNAYYAINDVIYNSSLPTGWYLKCTTPGITGSNDLIITSPVKDNTINDGTVVWTIKSGSDNSEIIKESNKNVENIIMFLAAQGMYPDFNALTYGVFGQENDDIDKFFTAVTSASQGSSLIEVENISGIIIGANYVIFDDSSNEEVQVKNIIKEDGAYSIVLSSILANSYDITKTHLCRTTAEISEGKAEIISESGNKFWNVRETWKGRKASSGILHTISMNTTLDRISNFEIDGDITFNANGMITLKG